MEVILTNKNLRQSAKCLQRALHRRLNANFEVVTEPGKVSPLIRWGNSSGNFPTETKFNHKDLIVVSGNKRTFSEVIGEDDCVFIRSGIPEKFPVVVRTVLNGMGGKGIFIARNMEEFSKYSKSSWSYWHNFKFELGVHILGGQIAKIFKKVRLNPYMEAEEFPLRNANNGYRFSVVHVQNFPKLLPTIDGFLEKLPIQMARLDIGWDSEKKKYIFIECNSAPSLSSNRATLELYADFLMDNL